MTLLKDTSVYKLNKVNDNQTAVNISHGEEEV